MQPEVIDESFSKEEINKADKRFKGWLNLLVLLLIPIQSLVSKRLFKKQGQNFAEHLILNTYSLGQQALIRTYLQFLYF